VRRIELVSLVDNVPEALQPEEPPPVWPWPGRTSARLKGERRGQHSIRINDQYRICFVWKDNDAYDVEIVDYH